jgi:hypothetical protein
MTRDQEIELFDLLSRTKLRDWIADKREVELQVLVQATDIELLRKAQGRAALLDSMTKLLDAAPGAVKR